MAKKATKKATKKVAKKATKKAPKKVAKKKGKQSVPKAEKRPGICSFVREFATKNVEAKTDEIIAAVDKEFPNTAYSVATVKAQAYRARKGLTVSGAKA